MSESCNHDWVRSNIVLLSNPPQFPKICRKCGQRGCDTGEYVGVPSEYDEIAKKFDKVNNP